MSRIAYLTGIEFGPGALATLAEPVVSDLVVRPEMLHLSASELTGLNVLKGKAETTYFLGNIGDIYLSVGQHQLRGQLSPPAPWAPGQDIWVRIDPASVLIYPARDAVGVAQAA